MLTLILGGERSGKSDLGLARLSALPGEKALVVTGRAMDHDFAARVARHRRERPAGLRVVEARREVAELLASESDRLATGDGLLLDSLDFWLFAAMEGGDADVLAGAFLAAADRFRGRAAPDLIVVSCEVGLGPVAASAATRRFVRSLGELNRRLAGLADEAVMSVAGLSLVLKTPAAG